jgi:glutamine amidotransferase-like uncharacterized protein
MLPASTQTHFRAKSLAQSESDERPGSRVLISSLNRLLAVAFLVLIPRCFTGCGVRSDGNSPNPNGTNASSAADAVAQESVERAPVLLFTGDGTSPNDVAAIESLLKDNHLNYATANSAQLDGMEESQLKQHRLLIVPGGNFIDMSNGLASNTTTNLRNAVRNGLNYLGICAGAFLAGDSGPGYNGLNLTSGVRFKFYSIENDGIRKAVVPISVAEGPTLEHYWEDGPELTGWGAIVGRYPDGTPAIVQGTYGNGSVILTGFHPEAPANWRRGMEFTTPVGVDNAYAWTLIEAAMNRISLPHY